MYCIAMAAFPFLLVIDEKTKDWVEARCLEQVDVRYKYKQVCREYTVESGLLKSPCTQIECLLRRLRALLFTDPLKCSRLLTNILESSTSLPS